MRILLRYNTALGSRTITAEGGDADTARAIAEAHRTQGFDAYVMEDEGRFDMKAHFRRVAASNARDKMRVIASDPKVTALRKGKRPC